MKFILYLTLLSMSCQGIYKISNYEYDCIMPSTENTYFRHEGGPKHSDGKKSFIPLNFEVYLPPDLKYYLGYNATRFEFYYSNKEVIIIQTLYTGQKNSYSKKNYVPTKEELEEYLEKVSSEHKKYDARKIKKLNYRKNRIMEYDWGTVYFYNIKRKNLDTYIELIDKSFKPI